VFEQILTIVVGAAGVLAGLVALFVLGWRAKSGLVLGPIVWFSKRFMNRRQMRTAGRPGAYAGIVRHVGRRSGTPYETPIGIVADGEGFLVALPYGTRSNWLRNVLAAGHATLVHEGEIVEVDRPELVAMGPVAARFPASDQPLFRVLRVDRALRLRRATVAGGGSVAA
jgi:deazaflavin-dependent oxidoreductase (nitroreductase family)